MTRNIGGSSGIALGTTMLTRRSQLHQQNLVSYLTPLDQNYQATLQGLPQALVERGADTVEVANQAQGALYGMPQQQATMRAFVDVFWLLGVVLLCAVPLVFLMRKAQPHKAPAMTE